MSAGPRLLAPAPSPCARVQKQHTRCAARGQVDVLSAELAAVKQQAHAHADAQQARLDEARQRLEDSSALLGEEVSTCWVQGGTARAGSMLHA